MVTSTRLYSFLRKIALASSCIFASSFGMAQTLGIAGTTTVTSGNSYTYHGTLNGSQTAAYSGPYTWNITNGVVTGTTNTVASGSVSSVIGAVIVNVTWTAAPATLKLTCGASNVTINITVITPLDPKTLAPSTQTINYGDAPPTKITAVKATGGAATPNYVYQWMRSIDDVNWDTIGGATDTAYLPGHLFQTTYFRRQVTETTTSTIAYTPPATVIVYPQLLVSIAPLSQAIASGTSGTTLTSSVTGGDGSYTYQWKTSTNLTTWTSGVTTPTSATGTLTVNKYFMLIVKSNGGTSIDTSNIASVLISRGVGNSIPDKANSSDIAIAKDSLGVVTYAATASSYNHTIKNVVALRLRDDTSLYIPGDFTASVLCTVLYGHSATDTARVDSIKLTVGYKKNGGTTYNSLNYFAFNGAEYAKVTVLRVDAPTTVNGVSFDTKKVLSLTNSISSSTSFEMFDNRKPTLTVTNPPAGPKADKLPVSWTFAAGTNNNTTQVEWAWIETELKGVYTKAGVFDTTSLLKNNSTRIDLAGGNGHYFIPLHYGGTGTLWVRVRGVNVMPSGSRADGPWCVAKPFAFTGHADSLNWQVTTTYAEEGKRKTVIQYYDGSLRARQTVTKDNTTDTAIRAETLYDGQGRPAIQILPAPGIDTILSYRGNLNKFNGQADNSSARDFFDFTTPTMGKDSTTRLDTTLGTSRYYSSANSGYSKDLPAANGFAYSVTRYTPDETGRVMKQGGVGDSMQMKYNHTTRYYYGTAGQEELDALFGTEVGSYTHYFKNMVVDPNGQSSVSYVDMHGRTIATALAGESPAAMQALAISDTNQYKNQAGKILTRNLLDSGSNVLKGQSIESVNTILVPFTTAYKFSYKLRKNWVSLPLCGGGNVIDTCKFDVHIVVSDESDSIVSTYDSIGVSSDSIQFIETLVTGSYRVRKTLTINQDSLAKFIQNYNKDGVGICASLDSLTRAITNAETTASGCATAVQTLTSDTCLKYLGTYSTYLSNYATSLGTTVGLLTSAQLADIRNQYISDSSFCSSLNPNTSHTLDNIRQQMINDMVPYGGQYADSTGSGTMYSKYNIFATGGGSAFTQPFYKTPFNEGQTADKYYTIYGVEDTSVTIAKLASFTRSNFEQAFQYSWAKSLLPYHPEFKKLVYAETNLRPTYNFIDSVNQNVVVAFNTIASDPFYTSISTGTDKNTMKKYSDTSWQSGYSMWQIAYGDALGCKLPNIDTMRSDCYKHMPKTLTTIGTVINAGFYYGSVTLSSAMQLQAWNVYKPEYNAERSQMVNRYICTHPSLDTTDAGKLADQHFHIYFPYDNGQQARNAGFTAWFPTPAGVFPTVDLTDSAAKYASPCDGYINTWRLALLKCTNLYAHYSNDTTQVENLVAIITARMDTVCKHGTDAANSLGSSTVAPKYAGTQYTSFEQVINNVMDSIGIGRSLFCNPYVIDFPKPYSRNPVLSKQLVGAVDTCGCRRFSQLKTEIVAGGGSTSSLTTINSYLKTLYKDTISQTLYNGYLRCDSLQLYNCLYDSVTLCSDDELGGHPYICHILSADTNFYRPLSTPQYLPYYLGCGFSDSSFTCNSCSVFMKYDTAFNTIFHHRPVFTGTLIDSDILYNDLYAQYVNFKTGLQHDWLFYQDTMMRTSCAVGGITGTPKSLSLCLSSQPLNDTTGMIQPVSPCQQAFNRGAEKAAIVYAATQQQLITSFSASYLAKCLADSEFFNVTDTIKEYHYTLYYYDQAGNLVRTIPPKGVNPIYRASWIDSVEKDKPLKIRLAPVHKYWTKYCYNSLNQVNMQKTPDAGTSKFYYDRLGRLALSQNAKQRLVGNEYSYTDYDSLGRITEVGQITAGTAMTDTISKSDSLLNAWFVTNTTKRGQITQTVYDTAYGPLAGLELDQQNLRNRVSYTEFIDTATNLIPSSATYYSYDIHGNVDTLVQDFGYGQSGGVLNMMNTSGNRFKKTVYDYDLISGKINQVSYQRNQPDAYYHRYDYDAENRITNVYSARDSVMLFLFQPLQEQEAQYEYYNHGPLMNTVLGKLQVQKQDYVYTLQGWLKGINPVMGGTLANGKDTTDAYIYGRDVYGFSLHYYNKDYRAVGTASASTTVLNAMGSGATQLYNGNIAAMAVTLAPFGGAGQGTRVYNYKYDQLNRLVAMDAHKGLYPAAGTLGTFTDTLLKDYQERVSYDPNGNILTYNRHGDAARLSMDSMTYSYLDTTNKLDKVVDLASDNPGYHDIRTGQANGNYKYDAIGNMTADVGDTVSNIKWTVYGKIASLVKSGDTIRYVYDASGNRILKQTHDDTTAYVRDATGNVLSVYTKQAGVDTVVRAEADIYGSSRLGMATQHMAPDTLITTLQKNLGLGTKVIFTRGEKLFELDNHLGNVLATVSDRKIEIDSDANGIVDSYRADVVSASDYYPFGMMMPSRNIHIGTDYRYGFNGKEKDKKISSQTAYDYGFRIYNPGIGKFLSVDPKTSTYPSLTSYQYASNSPIKCIDIDGLEGDPIAEFNIWLGNEWDKWKSWAKWKEAANNVNKTFNPLYIAVNHAAKIITAKDLDGNKIDERGRAGAVGDAGVDVMMWVTGERAVGVVGSYGVNPFESELNGAANGTEPKPSVTQDQAALKATTADDAKATTAATAKGTGKQAPAGPQTKLNQLQEIVNAATKPRLVPEKANEVVNYVELNNGAAMPGHKGGRVYLNDGREGSEKLPEMFDGKKVSYKEYDINPYRKGVNRGGERVVIGSDGKSYYTNNHYKNFTQIKK